MFEKQTVTCHFLDISVPNLRLRDFDHEGGTNIARCSKSTEPSEDFAPLRCSTCTAFPPLPTLFISSVVTVGETKQTNKQNVLKIYLLMNPPPPLHPLMRTVHHFHSPSAINNPLVCMLHKQKQTQVIQGGSGGTFFFTTHKVFISAEVMAMYFLNSVTNNRKLCGGK